MAARPTLAAFHGTHQGYGPRPIWSTGREDRQLLMAQQKRPLVGPLNGILSPLSPDSFALHFSLGVQQREQ